MTTKSYEYNNFYVSIITVRSNKNHMHRFKQRCQYMYLNQFICYCLITCRHCVGFDSNRLSWHVFIDICLHHITTHGCIARCPWYRSIIQYRYPPNRCPWQTYLTNTWCVPPYRYSNRYWSSLKHHILSFI